MVTYYAHASELFVSVGQQVSEGQMIAKIGMTGYTTGPHLHMEVASVSSKSAQYWNAGGIGIYGAIHMWNALYVNNTVLLRPENYNWQEFQGGGTVTVKTRDHFPWVLYARKLRGL